MCERGVRSTPPRFLRVSVSKLAPTDLVTLLDRIWSKYDELSEKHGVQKMETVGATYMAVGGLNMGADNAQPVEITEIALECITAAREVHPAAFGGCGGGGVALRTPPRPRLWPIWIARRPRLRPTAAPHGCASRGHRRD